jgi:transcriptional regulator with XRE-family HTH domain
MVNGVEAGGTNISLANLDHVAAALNVAFVDLVQPPRQPH